MPRYAVAAFFVGLLLAVNANAEPRLAKVLAVDEVSYAIIKTNFPQLFVHAEGRVNSTGWKNAELAPWVYLTPPADGVLSMDFVATPPDGIVLYVVSSISGEFYRRFEPWVKGVRIHASSNKKEVLFTDEPMKTSPAAADEEVLPWPWSYTKPISRE